MKKEEIIELRNKLPDNWKWTKSYEIQYISSATGREITLKHWALTAPDGKGLVCSLGLVSHDYTTENHKKFLHNDPAVEFVEKSLEIIDHLTTENSRLRELLREVSMRNNIVFPENEQDLKWFDEGMNIKKSGDLIKKLFSELSLAKVEALTPKTEDDGK